MADQEVLTRTLVELADTLVDDFDVVDLLSLLTDRCLEAFDVQAAGLMLAAPMGGELRVMASSSATMRDLELYEIQASDGPCIDCYRTEALSGGRRGLFWFSPAPCQRLVSGAPVRARLCGQASAAAG